MAITKEEYLKKYGTNINSYAMKNNNVTSNSNNLNKDLIEKRYKELMKAKRNKTGLKWIDANLDNIDENHLLNNILYKKTHTKHPSVLWTIICEENYQWLYNLLYELIHVYKNRYNKLEHKTERLLKYLQISPININKDIKFSSPPLTIKEESKISKCHMECYRYCYKTEKKHLGWKNIEDVPIWYSN